MNTPGLREAPPVTPRSDAAKIDPPLPLARAAGCVWMPLLVLVVLWWAR